ncbi:MAG: DUF6491 family protein [Caulobacterales bacterium]
MPRRLLLSLAIGAVATLSAGSVSDIAPAAPNTNQCFLSRDWEGWKASKDATAIYLRVRIHDFYRLDLTSACPELQWPDSHIVSIERGSDWICSPLDLDLKVTQDHGIPTPCIVKGITRLTDDEAAALPKDEKP